MLVLSTGGLLFVFNRNISFLAFTLLLVGSLFYIGKGINKSKYFSVLLACVVILVLFAINYTFAINEQSLTKYSFFGIQIFTTSLTLFYFMNQLEGRVVFVNSLYYVLKIILFHSLISFVAYFFVKDNLFLIVSQFQENLTFNYLFYYSPKEEVGVNFFGLDNLRNAGIFWEPGILQGYLNMLFFLEMSVFKRNKKLLVLIIAGILSTYSTTGLLLLLIQVLYFLQKQYKTNSAIVLGIIIATPIYFLLSANMDEKVHGDRESSFQKRLFDLTQPVFIALDHPLTGVGLDIDRFREVREEFYITSNLNEVFRGVGIEQKVETTSKGSTNSVMYLLAGMGFPTAILFIYMFIKQQLVANDRWIWFVITFITIMSEPLLFRPFFFIFIISGFSHLFYRIANHKKQLA